VTASVYKGEPFSVENRLLFGDCVGDDLCVVTPPDTVRFNGG
jgi:hypothetical protein